MVRDKKYVIEFDKLEEYTNEALKPFSTLSSRLQLYLWYYYYAHDKMQGVNVVLDNGVQLVPEYCIAVNDEGNVFYSFLSKVHVIYEKSTTTAGTE